MTSMKQCRCYQNITLQFDASNKNNIYLLSINLQPALTMAQSSTSYAVSQAVVSTLISHSKAILYEKNVIKNKMNQYIKDSSNTFLDHSIAQNGYQAEPNRRFKHSENVPDKMPTNIKKDIQCGKSLQIDKIVDKQSLRKIIPSPEKKQKKSKSQIKAGYYLSTNKKNIKTVGFNTMADFKQQKENSFVKLQEPLSLRIVPQRIKLQEETLEKQMRTEKVIEFKNKTIEEAHNKMEQELKKQKQKQMSQYLEKHFTKDNEPNSFTYGVEGQFLVTKLNQNITKIINNNYPPKINFSIDDNQQNEEDQLKDERPFFKRSETNTSTKLSSKQNYRSMGSKMQHIKPNERPTSHENHRIKSAKGEAFASAVLKTINLSKISMYGTMKDTDPIQFMKRNDLFNNNHCRQTTSIPFLRVESGMVYTESNTNQVVSHKENSTDGFTMNFKDHEPTNSHLKMRKARFTQFPTSTRNTNHCHQFLSELNEIEVCQLDEKVHKNNTSKVMTRPTRTADMNEKQRYWDRQSRPQTSRLNGRSGRITTANQSLVISLLQ